MPLLRSSNYLIRLWTINIARLAALRTPPSASTRSTSINQATFLFGTFAGPRRVSYGRATNLPASGRYFKPK